jgi:predicted RNA-binding protein YlxR (DUF448 family)
VSEPIRRCVGCGRRVPQRALLRFVAPDGGLREGRSEPGRGAYTCNRLACFERAAAGGGFVRTLRRQVEVDPALRRLYTEGSGEGSRWPTAVTDVH